MIRIRWQGGGLASARLSPQRADPPVWNPLSYICEGGASRAILKLVGVCLSFYNIEF